MKKVVERMIAPFGLSTDQIHGMLDYTAGVLLITLPWLFVTESNMHRCLSVMCVGTLLIVYSMFTDYKFGLLRWIPKKMNLIMDITTGVGLVALGVPALAFSSFGVLLMVGGFFVIASAIMSEIMTKKMPRLDEYELELS